MSSTMKRVTRLKKGDQVTINDGSWSTRMDKYESSTTLFSSCSDHFTVLKRTGDSPHIIGGVF